jgi:hypothetical protein
LFVVLWEADMRRTAPDLTGRRKRIYETSSTVLLVLSIGYALWTNYVVFVGGNLPLTPIHLVTEGSYGAGLFMLLIGDLILVLVLWFLLDGLLLNLLYLVLLPAERRANPGAAAPSEAVAGTTSPAAGTSGAAQAAPEKSAAPVVPAPARRVHSVLRRFGLGRSRRPAAPPPTFGQQETGQSPFGRPQVDEPRPQAGQDRSQWQPGKQWQAGWSSSGEREVTSSAPVPPRGPQRR